MVGSITNGNGFKILLARACVAASVVNANNKSTTSAVDASSSVDALHTPIKVKYIYRKERESFF